MKKLFFPAMVPLALLACMFLAGAGDATTAPAPQIPADADGARARLNASPRHGEWIEVTVPNSKTPLKCYIVYPERKDAAPVVVVIQEIFGLTDWLRGVGDQLAADGFIAIVPDLLSGKGPKGGGTDDFADQSAVTQAVSALKKEDVMVQLDAVRDYGLKLPSASGKSASVGFCWGGGMSFLFAATQPKLNAAAVYYGTPPADPLLEKIKCPIMGFYGGSDNRVTSTVKPTEEKMKKLNEPYTPHVFDGAGHGFLRQQTGQNGANQKAAQGAWPATIEFLKKNTE